MSQESTSQTKAALLETLAQGSVQLSPEQISTQNVARAAPAHKPRDITIADHDPGDEPIVIRI